MPFSEIDIVISDSNDNKIKMTLDFMFTFNGFEYVVGKAEDESTNLFKVVQGAEGKPELHDILDEEEFEAVKEYYLSLPK